MNLRMNDTVSIAGVDYPVDGFVLYRFADRTLRLARLGGQGSPRFLEPPASDVSSRALLLLEVPNLELDTPLPATIYHRGESYLLKLAGVAEVTVEGHVPDIRPGPCSVWRYRAARDQYLHVEAWPDGLRTLEGASVHEDMLEVRPQR